MKTHFIGLDTHGQFCDVTAVNGKGEVVLRRRSKTNIPALVALLELVPKPRHLVIEEGPLADWLWRNLWSQVEQMVVCEPRRNRLIAREGDKDDPIDAEKLAQLFRGGFVKAVHHTATLERACLKQHVSLYQQQVRLRVHEGHRARSLLRQHGIIVRERDFAQSADRQDLLARLPTNRTLREDLELLWQSYELAALHELRLGKRLVELAQQEEVVRRFQALPGIGWVRGLTLFVWLDTPWRFATKQALWRYLGIGLQRRRSGNGPERLGVPKQVNRPLKSTILGAAKSAAAQGDNPFADQYRRWRDEGLSARVARRNVARSLAVTLWGLWKNGSAYRPDWVGVAAAARR
ncbi:MAG TPA: IS110 family transposase [Gemmataceae bacterium]|nr:IS110 family transposase [Gemmataceae bacterium]